MYFSHVIGVTQPLGEGTSIYTEKLDFFYAKGPMGIFFSSMKKKKSFIPYQHQRMVPMQQFPQIMTLWEMMVMKLIYESMR